MIAAEILHELQSDPEMKRAHLALFLRCKESLRAHKVRLARNKRIGQFVRLLGHPGSQNYAMALAASVVLAATTALVMLAVERLRTPGVGGF